ncbi:hypothetical protein [Candidatus Enterovibrio altilux]|nr:hypothetical protein [Candidatus Enterovibrio luxaltus]
MEHQIMLRTVRLKRTVPFIPLGKRAILGERDHPHNVAVSYQ